MRFFLLVLIILTSGCSSKLEELRKEYRPSSAREAYLIALEETGISSSAMAKDWVRQGDESLLTQLSPSLPFVEEGVVEPLHIVALSYRLELKRGQRLTALGTISTDSDLFIDLFEIRDGQELSPRRIASADSTFQLEHEVTRTGTYVLRVQPEILASGHFKLELRAESSIIFPVSGKTIKSILSQFGVPRDAGRRQHHGVDIFAARGTPVVAVKAGRITSTKIGGLGGKTVWLRDNSGTSFYYAHLDSQLVSEGQWVLPGDTLGLVGNTGNARATSPHLHFGVYASGPHDPWHYLFDSFPAPAKLTVSPDLFGKIVTVTSDLLRNPSRKSKSVRPIKGPLTARVVGGSGTYLHVRLDGMTDGFVRRADVQISSDD